MEKRLDSIYEVYMSDSDNEFIRQSRERIDWICAQTNGNTVLDVGCSQGITSLLLGRKGKKVLGLDIEEDSILFANNVLAQENDDVKQSVQFKIGDYLTYPFENQQFDSIVMTEILEHIVDITPFLKKTESLLKDEGNVIVTVPFGINDFWDHKETYYVSKMYVALSQYFSITHIEFFTKWIGFICKKKTCGNESIAIDLELLEKEEGVFYQIERNLVDRNNNLLEQVKILNQKYKKALDDYATSKEWLANKQKTNEKLQSENQLLQEKVQNLGMTIEKIRQEYQNDLVSVYKDYDTIIAVLEEINCKMQHLEVQNGYLKSENEQYRRKLSIITESSWGKLGIKLYKKLKRIKAKFTRT